MRLCKNGGLATFALQKSIIMLSSFSHHFRNKIMPVLLATLFATACDKQDSMPVPPRNPQTPGNPSLLKAQFSSDAFTLSENAGEGNYQLNLSTAAAKAETVVISIGSPTAQYGRDFSTQPEAVNGRIQLNIQAGNQTASFKVIPVNNNLKDGTRELQFTITTEGSIQPEGRKVAKIVLADDDTKASIAFARLNASLNEAQTEGYVAELLITPMAFSDGFVEVNVSSATALYGTHFTTEPAAVNGKLRLPVPQNQSKVSFKIMAVNDAVATAARTLFFNLATAAADLDLGTQKQFSLTITDDDNVAPATTPIQAIRNSFLGTDTYFFADTYITGTVTSVNDNIAPAVAYIQDGTGGIALRFTTDNELLPGDVVRIDIQGAVLGERNGVLEINQLSQSSVVKTGSEIFVAPTTTITQLYTTPGNKEGQLVHLTGVSFAQANGTATLQGDRIISDGVRTAVVRTESFASFRNRLIPAGLVSVTGILIEQNGQYIILPLTSQSIR
jgi:hypothetical protein